MSRNTKTTQTVLEIAQIATQVEQPTPSRVIKQQPINQSKY